MGSSVFLELAVPPVFFGDSGARDPEADQQSAARFHQLTARQSGAKNIDWFSLGVAIA